MTAITLAPQRTKLGLSDGQLFIDGRWTDASDGATWTHVHPASGEEVGRFAVASEQDVDRAVLAARRAFDDGDWVRMRAADRKRILQRVVELLRERADELLRVQALDNGLPVTFLENVVYPLTAHIAADIFDHHAGWIDKLAGQTLPTHSGGDTFIYTLREPVGVVGAIIPWNAPMFLFAQKVAPALAAGCTIVLKPSEYATFSILRMTQVLEEAGVPPGVFNLVTGPGQTTGEALITHPQTDKLSFTGSRAVGRRVAHAAADGIKKVALELGGKSPNIVFADAPNLDIVAVQLMGMVSLGPSGQGCVCHTRALVERGIYDEMVEKAATVQSMVTHGDPFDPATTAGPLINAQQVERVMGLIARAVDDGCRLVLGGDRPGGDLAAGNFVNPTLFADVDNRSAIAQEEVFGPVLAVIPFDDEEDAMRLANDTSYGLGASVHTADVRKAIRMSRGVRAGTFGINGYTVAPNMPFGGFKQSGVGREGGGPGIEEFTELKTVIVGMDDVVF